jgi:hypothetical protein
MPKQFYIWHAFKVKQNKNEGSYRSRTEKNDR